MASRRNPFQRVDSVAPKQRNNRCDFLDQGLPRRAAGGGFGPFLKATDPLYGLPHGAKLGRAVAINQNLRQVTTQY